MTIELSDKEAKDAVQFIEDFVSRCIAEHIKSAVSDNRIKEYRK